MKKLLLVMAFVSMLTLTACGKSEVPNVIGMDYQKAKSLLESKGCDVTLVKQDASVILPNIGQDRAIKQGEVFSENGEYDKDNESPVNGTHKVTIEYAVADYKPKTAKEKAAEKAVADKKAAEAKAVADKKATEEKAEESARKKSGYIIDLKGTANEEDVHIVTADEEGTYAVECYDVPYPDDFATFQDYSDLKCYTTIFPDGKKYDMAMDSDKSIYDEQLTSPLYIKDLHDNGYEKMTYTGPDVALKKGYQIMVLNGSVKFTKE